MPTVSISVNGGRVDSRDASLLAPGELSKAEDCEYQPNDPAVWKIRGRTQANTSTENDIRGIAYCEFDGTEDKIVLAANTTYRIATASPSNLSFSDLTTGLVGGATLDTAYWQNKYYLFNGADRGRELSATGTSFVYGSMAGTSPLTIFHGMLRQTTACTASVGVGTINLSSGSTLTYWVEERVKDSAGNIIKRSAATAATCVTITGPQTNAAIVVYSNAFTNSETTHWALYGTATNNSFPIGAEIAEANASVAFLTDTRTGTDPALPSGSEYELLSVSIAGVTTNTPRNDQPPTTPSTCDMFEDSLVLNDASDLSKIWYSWEGTPHAFPAENFVDFPKSDEVKCIRRLGDFLIVLLRDSVWRLSFLPRPTDAEFSRGRVKVEIEGAHGGVGPNCATTFSSGQGLQLAYISRYGLLTTNGDGWDVLSGDLKWESAFNVARLGSAVLIDNPAKFRLELSGPSPDSLVNDVTYFFHYHPSHLKENGQLKFTGPIHRPTDCAEVAHIGGVDYVFSAARNKLLLNDNGKTEPLATLAMSVRTGDLSLAGPGNSAKIISLWAHHSSHPKQQATVTHISRNSGVDDSSQPATIDLKRREATITGWFGEGEAFQFGFDNDDALGPVAVNYFMADVDNQGDTGEG